MYSSLSQAQAQVQDLSKQLKHAQQVNAELSSRNGELERDNQALHAQNSSMAAELAKLKAHANDLQDRLDNLLRENKQLSGEEACGNGKHLAMGNIWQWETFGNGKHLPIGKHLPMGNICQ